MHTTHPHPVAEILVAIGELLVDRGYADGYCYDADDWRLIELRFQPASNCYYALIEVNSDEPDLRFAIYEIDANSSSEDDIFEDPVRVGSDVVDFPADAVEVEIDQAWPDQQ